MMVKSKTWIRIRFLLILRVLSFVGIKKRGGVEKLEFGCGNKLTPGYVGVDIRPFRGVLFLCNAWEIQKFLHNNVVDEIYSRHFFEHLTFPQIDMTLKSWHGILKTNGKLRIVVPDLDYHIKQFSGEWLSPAEFNEDHSNLEHALGSFYGWQKEGDHKFWDVHKSGFNFSLLKLVLEKYGFKNLIRIEDKPWNLVIECVKMADFKQSKEKATKLLDVFHKRISDGN